MSQVDVSNDLRRLVRERAAEACEYCLTPEAFSFYAHEVDHVTAMQHGGETLESNLALACVICNKYKGTNLTSIDPQTGEIAVLFHPRRDRWSGYFRIQNAEIVPLHGNARATARLLRLNDRNRIAERRMLIAAGLLRTDS